MTYPVLLGGGGDGNTGKTLLYTPLKEAQTGTFRSLRAVNWKINDSTCKIFGKMPGKMIKRSLNSTFRCLRAVCWKIIDSAYNFLAKIQGKPKTNDALCPPQKETQAELLEG